MRNPLDWEAPDAATPIAVGASPFTFQNTTPGNVIVSGGTVSSIEVSRNRGEFINAGLLSGMYFLSPGDSFRVTYAVTPTMTWVPI